MTLVGSDPLIATRPIVLPKQRVEHVGLANERVVDLCIYLFSMKKLALITMQGNGLLIAFSNQEKQ